MSFSGTRRWALVSTCNLVTVGIVVRWDSIGSVCVCEFVRACVRVRTGARVFGCVCVCARVCVRVWMCVCVRERERETDRQTKREFVLCCFMPRSGLFYVFP